MGLLAFLNLGGSDAVAFAISCLIGFFAGCAVPSGGLEIFTSLLVSYHLFLAWLVFSGKYKTAMPTSLLAAGVTHVCCMVLLIVPVALARGVVPFFDAFRYAMVGLALFERSWLFSGSEIRKQAKSVVEIPAPRLTPKQLSPKLKVAKPVVSAPILEPTLNMAATGQRLVAWEDHLARQRPGTPEYEAWMRSRRKPAVKRQPASP